MILDVNDYKAENSDCECAVLVLVLVREYNL